MYVPRNLSNIPKAKAKLSGGRRAITETPSRTKPRQIVAVAVFSNTVHVGSMEEWSSVRLQRCSSTSMQHSYVAVIRIFAQCVTKKAFASPPKGLPTNLSKFCELWAWPIYSGRAVPICPASLTDLCCILACSMDSAVSVQRCLKTLNENF